MVIFPFALSLIFSLSLGLLPPQPPPPVPSTIAAGTTSALPNSSRRHQCPPPQSAPQPFYAPLTLSPPPASSSSSSPSPLALDRAAVSRPGRHERSDAGSNRLRWVLAAALTRVPTPWTRCPLHHLSVCVCSIWSWSSILCYTLVSGAAPTLALLRPWRPSRQEAKHVIREQNTMVANEIIELFYELIVTRFPIIAKQKECRADLKEGICSLIFAAPRCSEFPELSWMRDLLEKKYGKDFVAAAFICAQMLVSIPCKAN